MALGTDILCFLCFLDAHLSMLFCWFSPRSNWLGRIQIHLSRCLAISEAARAKSRHIAPRRATWCCVVGAMRLSLMLLLRWVYVLFSADLVNGCFLGSLMGFERCKLLFQLCFDCFLGFLMGLASQANVYRRSEVAAQNY